jgi:excisionase family DNA binding protein
VPDEFLTVTDIAEFVKLNSQTVRNVIDRGETRAVRVAARRVRGRRVDLEAVLEAGGRHCTAEPSQPSAGPEPPEVDEGSVPAWVTFGALVTVADEALDQ